MQIQPLIWRYIGHSNCLWEGSTRGLLGHIRFEIAYTGESEIYSVQSDFRGIDNTSCEGVFNAKVKAQELLNSYAISLTIF